jgi:hypothetical protein
LAVVVALLVAGCGHAGPRGEVDGYFRLPGRPAADVQRGGLNFLPGKGTVQRRGGILGFLAPSGSGHGHVARVGADGRYSVTLPPGSYTVIGGLSGDPEGPAPESCAATITVVVTAHGTTRADFVCHATPVNARSPASPTTP